MNETIQVLKERRSIRQFKAEQISPETLDQILECGTLAPSGMGRQAAVMVVVQDPETLHLMSSLNAEIMGKPDMDPFYGAPTCVVILSAGRTAVEDGSLVAGNLMNAGWALGVGSCWVNRAKELFERPEGKELLKKWNLPETMIGVGNCVLGYLDCPVPPAHPRKPNYIVRV
ncbi:MAG: nitroreductase family protein [Oscillibacter sp.]